MSLGRFAELDAGARAGIEAACNFINHKIAELRRRIWTASAIAAVAALGVWTVTGWDWRIPLVGALAVMFLVSAHAHRELSKWYKNLLIKRVVEAVGNGLRYSPQSSLGKEDFRAMDCYRDRIDVWKSEDQISGARNNVSFALHEVRAARREKRGKNTVEVIVFRGYVVVLEFNKNFLGHTIVVPDAEAKILGGLFGQSNSRGHKQLVSFSDADFEKQYAVYATDDQEAHYLLTPKLMELIMRARASLGDLRMAFYQNSLYVTVPSDQDRFEANIFGGRVTPETIIGDLGAVVALANQLIDAFDLETRIWSRT